MTIGYGAAEKRPSWRPSWPGSSRSCSSGTGAEVMQRIAVPMIGGHGVVDLADIDRHPRDLRGGERDCDPIATFGAGLRAHMRRRGLRAAA
jgi:hypothetical protein